MRRLWLGLLLWVLMAGPSLAHGLIEPHMHIAKGPDSGPQVALTFDACSGQVDPRILDMLIANKIPATIFVTGRWLKSNPGAIAEINLHPELFEVEDHGAMHIPAVLGTQRPYGLKPAGTVGAVLAEVDGGAAAVVKATGHAPVWYRDATALYSPSVIPLIEKDGYKIAGFSLNGDLGASVSTTVATQRIGSARNGDVIISHINQPKRPAGAGVAAGILALKAKGFTFVLLRDAQILPD